MDYKVADAIVPFAANCGGSQAAGEIGNGIILEHTSLEGGIGHSSEV